MIEKYNLMSNSIKGGNLSHDEKEIYQDWGGLWKYIQNTTSHIYKNRSKKDFEIALLNTYSIAEYLRGMNASTALNFYNNFYMSLVCNNSKKENTDEKRDIEAFLSNLDYTEIFYNHAKLFSDIGNIDKSMYYVSLANEEYSKHNTCNTNEFVLYLLSSNGNLLWNVIPDILSYFRNYSIYKYNPIELLISNGENTLNKELYQSFFGNLDTNSSLMLIKYLRELIQIGNFQSENKYNSNYNSLVIFRTLGNVTWLLENRMKTKLGELLDKDYQSKTLSDLLPQILRMMDRKLSREFSRVQEDLKSKYTNNFDLNTQGLSDLLNEFDQFKDDTEFLLPLLVMITIVYRNYSSHYLDNSLSLGNSYFLKLKLILIILTVFLLLDSFLVESLEDKMKIV